MIDRSPAEPDSQVPRFEPVGAEWTVWSPKDPTRFSAQAIGDMLVRREGERSIRLRLHPEVRHTNISSRVHGGVLMTMIDVAMFTAAQTVTGKELYGSVTLDIGCNFMDSGVSGTPVDVVAECLRETGRLVFLRGLIVQDDRTLASFNATLRKPGTR